MFEYQPVLLRGNYRKGRRCGVVCLVFTLLALIAGTARSVVVLTDVSNGERFTSIGFFERPYAISYDALRNRLAISDMGKNCVYVFSLLDYSWILYDQSSGVNEPAGIAFSKDGTLYISNKDEPVILKFGLGADIPDSIDLKAGGLPDKISIERLYIDKMGRLFAVDSGKRAVYLLDRNGKLTQRIGDELSRPGGVIEKASGEILIADRGIDPILLFSKDGSFIRRLSRPEPVTAKRIRSTRGLAKDTNGWLYTVDVINNEILIFDPNGISQWEWSSSSQPFFPVDIAVDKDDLIYVLESGGGRVLILKREF